MKLETTLGGRASHGPDEIDECALVVVVQVGQVVGEVSEVVAGADLQMLADITIDRKQRAIAAFDLSYDLTADWSIGGKYAYRLGQVSLDRVQRKFFDNAAQLVVLRVDWRFLNNWESLAELRMLDLPDVDQRRDGALVAIYRYIGKNLKVGVGYNFTDFSDDLTNMSYDHQGAFVNLIGTM